MQENSDARDVFRFAEAAERRRIDDLLLELAAEDADRRILVPSGKRGGVTDGTRTRNGQNHNLELYH